MPLFSAIVKSLGSEFQYEHREATLMSMTKVLLKNKIIKRRADGIVRYHHDEILLIELCGAFGNTLMSKIQFDRHKAVYGMLGMLKFLADKYEHGSLQTFKKLEIVFIHTKGKIFYRCI